MTLLSSAVPAGRLFDAIFGSRPALSDGMKQMLAPMRAVNSSSKAEKSRTREDRGANEAPPVLRPSIQSCVTHPEIGRKALYVNGGQTLRFAGMTEAESAPLLALSLRASGATRVHLPVPQGARLGRALDNVVRFTIRSTIITASAASCTVSRWPEAARDEQHPALTA
jgi:hypothetical protein